MAQRHLRQLLREKQEPFVLESFIEERRGQLLRHRQELKRRVPLPLSKNPTFSSNPSQSPSFISKRSPIFDASVKNPSFGLKPAAYLIIEAALRIQEKQRKNKRGNSIKALSFGFFGSILKRLALRKGRREIDTEEIKVFGGTRPEKKEYGEGVHEEKETQFSPVSVLDPSSFAEEDEDDHPPEHSNAQRTRHKLRRLESLAAGLVPIELDQLLALEQDNENVTDITDEERQMLRSCKLGGNGLLERMCARFEAWKEAGHCTIDMMVELDFRHDGGEWKRCEEQVPEIAAGIEISIFEFLVSELFDELVL
ncbi:hypothetical protein J5N97_021398 [Dioscorea zingiberensis]|uniref:DUF4378 domain-containing protein n=1 Tax=Dioscorea zingiberensis TaxID=325984 RepID=A0A9D5CID3_9LILI|nr:hypothetical protein J5N97_021398 [Dioscorea zingiberensis]